MSGDTTEVLLAALSLLGALAVGTATGGRFEQLGHLRLQRPWLVVAGMAAQLGGALEGAYALGLVLSVLAVTAFLALNRSVAGIALVALGLLANAVVVVANGAMPVSLHAAFRAGASMQDVLTGADPRHELATDDTRFRPLSDVIPVASPWRPEVVSPGDVLVAAGLAQLVVVGMRRRTA